MLQKSHARERHYIQTNTVPQGSFSSGPFVTNPRRATYTYTTGKMLLNFDRAHYKVRQRYKGLYCCTPDWLSQFVSSVSERLPHWLLAKTSRWHVHSIKIFKTYVSILTCIFHDFFSKERASPLAKSFPVSASAQRRSSTGRSSSKKYSDNCHSNSSFSRWMGSKRERFHAGLPSVVASQNPIFVQFIPLNPPDTKRHLNALHSVVYLLFCSRTCSSTSTLYIS